MKTGKKVSITILSVLILALCASATAAGASVTALFSGDKACYLFGGRDVTGRIARITMTQNGETCTMENAEGKTHFLFCTERSPRLGDYDFDRSTLRFYDEDGNDITAEYNLSGGRIA